jgi:glycosidase
MRSQNRSMPVRTARRCLPLAGLALWALTAWPAWAGPGNAWHMPWELQAGIPMTMRDPVYRVYPDQPLVLYSGNQFQGSGGTPGNQLEAGSTVFYRINGTSTWSQVPMQVHGTSGNNQYFRGVIPAGTGAPGQVLEYYFRSPYSDHDLTYIHASDPSWYATTLSEGTARANPFRVTIQPPPLPANPSPPDWRDVTIYQIFTDRFYDGDPSNNTLSPSAFSPTTGNRVHGGDFRGIEKKLDYIKALGANAIWISPVQLNVTHGAYHGYHADDFYALSSHWGTMDDLRSMVSNAHKRGIYVLLDIVVNHQGDRIFSTDAGFPSFNFNGYSLRWRDANRPYPPPFNRMAHFHNYGAIGGNYYDPHQYLGEFIGGLDDLRTSSQYVRAHMVEIYKYWIEQTNVDGFRIDTVKHVDMGFWQYFNPAIRAHAAGMGKTNFLQLGEVYDGDSGKLGSYTGTRAGGAYTCDTVFDFSLYFRINSVFARADGNTRQLEDHYNSIAANYHPDAHMRLVTFLDNHDLSRFMNWENANNNTGRLHVAASFLLTSRGIPSLYYGTEQNFNGGHDPHNREDMFAGQYPSGGPSWGDRFNMTGATFRHVALLNNFRRLYPSLRRGEHRNRWNNPSGPGLFAYARVLGGEEVFVVFNTAGSAQVLPPRSTSYPAGTVLVNLLNTNETLTVTAGTEGQPSINVPATSAKLFIARSRWRPLDPVVIQQAPAHAIANWNPLQPIVLQFSKPMNTNAVQAAFSLTPHKNGSFSWSPDRATMTFTPSGSGFAGEQRYAVRLNESAADSVDGLPMHGGFETFFVTGANNATDFEPPTMHVSSPAPYARLSNLVEVMGVASDNVAVSRVEVSLDGGNWITASGTAAWSHMFDSRFFRNGSRYISARAIDTSGNVSPAAEVPVHLANKPPPYQQRIRAGSEAALTDCEGRIWAGDRPYQLGAFGHTGGAPGFIGNTIQGVCGQAQSLYQHERYGVNGTAFGYRFDCPPGVYRVTVHQAENWVNGPGQRLMNVSIQQDVAGTGLDIFAQAGGQATPVQWVFTNVVEEGPLDILFTATAQNPRVAGIDVQRIGDVDTSGDGIPDWWMYWHFDRAVGDETSLTHAQDDFAGSGMSNFDKFIAGLDPLDAADVLRVELLLDAGPTDEWIIQWPSVAGRVYGLQTSTNLVSGFAPLVSNIMASPPVNIYTASPPVGADSLFLNISVDWPEARTSGESTGE